MKRYNLVNLPEQVSIIPDCYGDWVRYNDIKKLLNATKEVCQWDWETIFNEKYPNDELLQDLLPYLIALQNEKL